MLTNDMCLCVRARVHLGQLSQAPLGPDKKMAPRVLDSSYTRTDAHTCKHILSDAHTPMGMHIYVGKPLL